MELPDERCSVYTAEPGLSIRHETRLGPALDEIVRLCFVRRRVAVGVVFRTSYRMGIVEHLNAALSRATPSNVASLRYRDQSYQFPGSEGRIKLISTDRARDSRSDELDIVLFYDDAATIISQSAYEHILTRLRGRALATALGGT